MGKDNISHNRRIMEQWETEKFIQFVYDTVGGGTFGNKKPYEMNREELLKLCCDITGGV